MYKNIELDENGNYVGTRLNEYVIPIIIEKSNLKVNKTVQLKIQKKLSSSSVIKNNKRTLDRLYKNMKEIIKKENKNMSQNEIEKNAAKWIVYISQCGSITRLLKKSKIDQQINKTKDLYKNMEFNKYGKIIDYTENKYVVPQIIKDAELKLSTKAKEKLKQDILRYKILRECKIYYAYKKIEQQVKRENPKLELSDIRKYTCRWLIYIIKYSSVVILFSKKRLSKQLLKTKDKYLEQV